MEPLKVGIIGAGLIGGKRALALQTLGDHLIGVADILSEKAQVFSEKYHCKKYLHWNDLISDPEINCVIVSTSNNAIPECASEALGKGKHVLIEKPGGRNPSDLKMIAEKNTAYQVLGVGFNHRFHPAMLKANELLMENAIGEIMYLRARYGHGGRVGYDREWRANPELSGGGELLDQGVHLIDLAHWFVGEFQLAASIADTFYWDMPVEDNGFLILKTKKNQVAFLHASCTEWKNTFEFEIFGKKGKLQICGLGGSYGPETLKYFKVKPEMGVPIEEKWEFLGEDLSWQREWQAFRDEIIGKKTYLGKFSDAEYAMKIIYDVYKNSEQKSDRTFL